jgi:hypothetical protein
MTLIASLAVIAFASSAVAQAPAKQIEITVSARALATPTSRLCMPKEAVGKKKDKMAPKTMCHTREEWEAMGVLIKTR